MPYFPYSFWNNNLRSSLIAFWTFNNCSDLGKDNYNGFNLTVNGLVDCPSGKIGNSVKNTLDPTAFIDVTDSNKKFNLTTDKTFVLWAKVAVALGLGGYFFGKQFNSPDNNYVFGYDSAGIPFFLIDTGASQFEIGADFTLSNDTWVFCVIKHYLNTKKISIQINNLNIVETTYTGDPVDPNQNFRALEESSVGSSIDAFGAWNRILTSSEITFLYNNGIGREYPF